MMALDQASCVIMKNNELSLGDSELTMYFCSPF
jgi:hypothetical protein